MKAKSMFLAVSPLIGLAFVAADVGAQNNESGNFPGTENSSGLPRASTDVDAKLNESVAGLAWETNAPIPTPNGTSQTTTGSDYFGNVYVIGGGTGSGPDVTLNLNLRYSPDGSWTTMAPVPTPLRAFGAIALVDGDSAPHELFYIFGGFNGSAPINTLNIYNTTTNTWSTGAPIPPAGGGFGVGVCQVNGRIFLAGGATSFTLGWEYHVDTNTYSPIAPMGGGGAYRTHAAGVDATNECHFFANGFDGRDHNVYHVDSNTWTFGTLMPIGVTDPAVAAVGSDIYVAGGPVPGVPGYTQILDGLTGTWSMGPRLPGPVNNTSGTLANNTFYVEGGYNGVNSIPTNYSLSFGGGTLIGEITDADTGVGIAGARVTAVGGVTRFSVAGANGVYRLRVPKDTYDLTASAYGYISQTVPGIVVTEEGKVTQDFALTAAPSHSVSGTVTNSVTELPVRGAQVRILGTPLPPATTDADGFYGFPVVADGTYDIEATAGGFRPSRQSITVDQDVEADFVLDPAADCARVPGNLVANCGFDSGDFTGWTRSGELSATVIDRLSAHSGDFGLDTGPRFALGFISQNLPTTPGGSYSLCYWLRRPGPSSSSRFQVIWNGEILREDANLPVSAYTRYCIDVVAPGNSSEVKFGFRDDASVFYFDDVSVAPQ